jgi:hypothetical protein
MKPSRFKKQHAYSTAAHIPAFTRSSQALSRRQTIRQTIVTNPAATSPSQIVVDNRSRVRLDDWTSR